MAIGIHGILNTAQENKPKMSASALEARRQYYREYYQRTKERQKAQKAAYWERIAAKSDSGQRKTTESARNEGNDGSC